MTPRWRAIDQFAGGGGSSTGLAQAGLAVVWAGNHDPDAVAVHRANHPGTEHALQDLAQADWRRIPEHDFLWASPACVPAEAMVELADGTTRRADELRVGDVVLTHEGRGRPVVNAWTKSYTGRMVNLGVWGDSKHELRMTEDHLVWVRRREGHDARLGAPRWMLAAELTSGDYVAFPRRKARRGVGACFVRALRPPARMFAVVAHACAGRKDYPAHDSRSPGSKVVLDGNSTALWWLVGHYLGDGEARDPEDRRGQVGWSCGASTENAEKVREALRFLGLSSWDRDDGGNLRVYCSSTHLHAVCTAFGRLCHEKAIPGALHELETPLVEAMLDGYLAADGHEKLVHGKVVNLATSTSLPLLQGVQRLCWNLGWSASISRGGHGGERKILGRDVTCRDWWQIGIRKEPHAQSRTKFDLDPSRVWRSVHDVTYDQVDRLTVYDFEVEEDHTFCLPGLVVHNCQGHSTAATHGLAEGRRGTAPAHDGLRSTAWAAVSAAEVHRPRYAIVENVKEFRSWVLYPAWLAAWRALGYHPTEHLVDAADLGVPQDRTRLFVVLSREGPVTLPQPRHAPGEARVGWHVVELDRGDWRPVAAAQPLQQARIRAAIEAHGQREGAVLVRAISDNPHRSLSRPLPTITTKCQLGLAKRDGRSWVYRPFLREEYARGMGFPDDYDWLDHGVTAVGRMAGNAVVPAVARWIAEEVTGGA